MKGGPFAVTEKTPNWLRLRTSTGDIYFLNKTYPSTHLRQLLSGKRRDCWPQMATLHDPSTRATLLRDYPASTIRQSYNPTEITIQMATTRAPKG